MVILADVYCAWGCVLKTLLSVMSDDTGVRSSVVLAVEVAFVLIWITYSTVDTLFPYLVGSSCLRDLLCTLSSSIAIETTLSGVLSGVEELVGHHHLIMYLVRCLSGFVGNACLVV